MIQIAIIEDEDYEANKLLECLLRFAKEHDEVFSLHRYCNGIEFLSVENRAFDLVFMDVEMPLLDGLQTAKRLREKDSHAVLVFITKMFQYAINGYEYDATDFIIKPLRYPSFSLKMEKLVRKFRQSEDKHIAVKYSGGAKILPASTVSYVELQGHRIIYHTDDGDLSYYGNGKQVEEILPMDEFFRCNSGYFVNLKRVTGLDGFSVFLGDIELSVSHARKKKFLEVLHNYYARQR